MRTKRAKIIDLPFRKRTENTSTGITLPRTVSYCHISGKGGCSIYPGQLWAQPKNRSFINIERRKKRQWSKHMARNIVFKEPKRNHELEDRYVEII